MSSKLFLRSRIDRGSVHIHDTVLQRVIFHKSCSTFTSPELLCSLCALARTGEGMLASACGHAHHGEYDEKIRKAE